jgi:hypothetical protein
LCGIAWGLTYPSESDPKNIKYVLWKAGLYRMNPDVAVGTMIGDSNRDELVLGKTKEVLRKRFGYLLTLQDASPYLRSCYQQGWDGNDVLFIRSSPWMIVFNGNRAAKLVLIKGC